MKNFWPFRPFELLLAIVASLSLYEILSIGYDLQHTDPSLTITYFVSGHLWSMVLAALTSIGFGVGLAIHFYFAWRDRGGKQ